MASDHTVGFEPADELAKDRESVRRRFWTKLKRVVARLPFAEELLAAQGLGVPARCSCHAVQSDCCPTQLRGVQIPLTQAAPTAHS